MQQTPHAETNVAHLGKKFSDFYRTRKSLEFSYDLTIGPFREPYESSRYNPNVFL